MNVKRRFLLVLMTLFGAWLGVVVVCGESVSFEAVDDFVDEVVLGEEDLAERAEILRNQYRRMTPGAGEMVQEVGTWPAAWEEFGPGWGCAAVERELATWVVPVVARREGRATVLEDGEGAVLWRGATDFAKEEAAGVVLAGALIDEFDWPFYDATRREVVARRAEAWHGGRATRLGATETNFCLLGPEKLPDGGFRVTVTNGGTNAAAEIFSFTMTADSYSVTNIWTNDENVVTSMVTTAYSNWSPSLVGFSSSWTRVAAHVPLTNGVGSWTDTTVTPTDHVRFYAAALLGDEDGDRLTDGMEQFVWNTLPDNADSDGDLLEDAMEIDFGLNPNSADSDGDGVLDRHELDPSLEITYMDIQEGAGIVVSRESMKADWTQGHSLGSNGWVRFNLQQGISQGIWATIREWGYVPESFDYVVSNAIIALSQEITLAGFRTVQLFLIPDASANCSVTIRDTSAPLSTVVNANWVGADIVASFDVVSAEIGDIERVPPGGFTNLPVVVHPSPLPFPLPLQLSIERVAGQDGVAALWEPPLGKKYESGPIRIFGIQSSWGFGSMASPENLELRATFCDRPDCMQRKRFTVCAHLSSLWEIDHNVATQALHFIYTWDSDSGSISDLDKVWVGEHVTYSDGGVHRGEGRPWKLDSYPITITPPRTDANGAIGGLEDYHLNLAPAGESPYPGPADSIEATQHFGFHCFRCDARPDDYSLGWQQNLLGPLSILRSVFLDGGYWTYHVEKCGFSAEFLLNE